MNLHLLICSLVLFANYFEPTSAQVCRTVSGPSPNSNCVLPFIYNGKTYYQCPVDPEDSSKYWCSTKVDRNGKHISNIGAYGHCGSNCPLEGSSSRIIDSRIQFEERPRSGKNNQCYTVGGPNPGKPCVFPFKWNGKTYTGCPIDADDRSKRWCSTKVDYNGNHVVKQSQYGFCDTNCPVDNSHTSSGGSYSNNNNNHQISNQNGCYTVGGPNSGKPCKFPFKWNGQTYTGCPIDNENPSKRWCSTKVDRYGKHVANQNQYGFCSSSCPIHNGGGGYGGGNGNGGHGGQNSCPSGQTCKPIVQCGTLAADGSAQSCQLSGDGFGVCCNSVSSNLGNGIINNNGKGQDIGSIADAVLKSAVDFGVSFAQNVSTAINQFGHLLSTSSPEYKHSLLQKPNKDIKKGSDASLLSAFAAKVLKNGDSSIFRQYGLNNVDISGSLLAANCPKSPRCNFNNKYRNIDGSCNNKNNPKYGKYNTPLQRILPNAYDDGVITPRRFNAKRRLLPSPRLITQSIVGTARVDSRVNTAMLMTFGQFIDHDLTHVPMKSDNGEPIDCCNNVRNPFDPNYDTSSEAVCFPIQIPPNDAHFKGRKTCMNFARSETALSLNCQPGPLQQVNQLTHWLDASNIYGSNEEEMRQLRSFRNGLLRTQSASDGGELLPQDRKNECIGGRSTKCFLAGDSRVNEQPNLAVMHTLYLREHNRIAKGLKSVNPQWNDEKLFQESKRIVTAAWQHHVYNEWLPVILGKQFMRSYGLLPLSNGFSSSYRSDIDPRITNVFAAAAFRMGHTLIPDMVKAFSSGGSQIKNIELKDAFGNIDVVEQRSMVDGLMRGMLREKIQKADRNFADDIVNHLFAQEQSDGLGLDLVAMNIQRGRDHGLPGYVEYRKKCNLGSASSFDGLSSNISPKNIQLLKRVYQDVKDVDPYVGMFLEKPAPGAIVGRTFLCIIGDQFARLRIGDRYFYDLQGQPGSFTLGQLNEIRKSSISRLICDNMKGIVETQPLALYLPDNNNKMTRCYDHATIPSIDLSYWKE